MMSEVPQRSDFRIWTQDRTRYADTDRQGHVNNAVFATFFESGRVAFLLGGGAPLAPPGFSFVIARLTIEFRQELLWNQVVDIGTDIRSLGRSSMTLAQGLFRGEDCVATAEGVVVLTDEATRRSTPMPEAMRTRLLAISAG